MGQRELVRHLEIVLGSARARNQTRRPPPLRRPARAWARRRSRASWPTRWARGFASRPARCSRVPGDLAALLTDLHDGDVLFIDEIHRLSRAVEEVLYPAMEDRRLDVMIGRGPSARSIRLDLPNFTLVGATTRTGLVAAPLRDRFGFVGQLDLYDVDELTVIVERSARLLGVDLDGRRRRDHRRDAAAGRRGSPTGCCAGCATSPRCRVTDASTTRSRSKALELFGVDEYGLDKIDRRILACSASSSPTSRWA